MNNKYTVFIPARGGSKSIPLKNIKTIAGQPLIYWALDAACASNSVHRVVVSTDSEEIKKIVESHPDSHKIDCVHRSESTATDEASTESAIIEFINRYTISGNIILMQATSPLVTSDDLDMATEHFEAVQAQSLLSVVRQKRFIWEEEGDNVKKNVRPVNYSPANRPRRQEFEGFIVENGAFYIFDADKFLEHRSRLYGDITYYEMGEESYVELDEPHDWALVETLLFQKQKPLPKIDMSSVKLFVTDVDGVLTDAGMYYTEAGDELKKFNTRDGMGLELLRKHGIKTAIITSENTKIVERRAKKLKTDYLVQGCKDKLTACKEICNELNISLNEVAFVGDDINDLELLKHTGVAACPSDAVSVIKKVSGIIVSDMKGGNGVVRDIAQRVLAR